MNVFLINYFFTLISFVIQSIIDANELKLDLRYCSKWLLQLEDLKKNLLEVVRSLSHSFLDNELVLGSGL